MRKTDLAYVAGIVDGEGSISIIAQKTSKNRFGHTFFVQVSVANTNEWLVRQLQMFFGGSVYYNKRKVERGEGNWKPVYKWQIDTNGAVQFLVAILPYLKLKKAQAEIVISFQDRRNKRPKNHKLMPKTEGEHAIEEAEQLLVHTMNKRGIRS